MLGFNDGVSKHDNSRQGRSIDCFLMNEVNEKSKVKTSLYTLAPIDYKDLNNTKLTKRRAKYFCVLDGLHKVSSCSYGTIETKLHLPTLNVTIDDSLAE